jgi:hypothetical protein
MEKQTYHVQSSLRPAIVDLPKGTFVVPAWVEVPRGTTLDQIVWENEIQPKSNPSIIKVEGSSGSTYFIQKIGNKYKCSCPGYFRSKDRVCKHIKQLK